MCPTRSCLPKGSSITTHTASHFPYLVHQSDGHALLIHQELEEVPTKVSAQPLSPAAATLHVCVGGGEGF